MVLKAESKTSKLAFSFSFTLRNISNLKIKKALLMRGLKSLLGKIEMEEFAALIVV